MCGLASSSTRLTHHTGAEAAQSPHDPPAEAASLPLEVPKEQTVSQDRKHHLQQGGLGSPQPVHTVCTVRAAWYEHTEYLSLFVVDLVHQSPPLCSLGASGACERRCHRPQHAPCFVLAVFPSSSRRPFSPGSSHEPFLPPPGFL